MPLIPTALCVICVFLYFAFAKFLDCKDQAEYDMAIEEYEEAKRKWPQGSGYMHLPPQHWNELDHRDQPKSKM